MFSCAADSLKVSSYFPLRTSCIVFNNLAQYKALEGKHVHEYPRFVQFIFLVQSLTAIILTSGLIFRMALITSMTIHYWHHHIHKDNFGSDPYLSEQSYCICTIIGCKHFIPIFFQCQDNNLTDRIFVFSDQTNSFCPINNSD